MHGLCGDGFYKNKNKKISLLSNSRNKQKDDGIKNHNQTQARRRPISHAHESLPRGYYPSGKLRTGTVALGGVVMSGLGRWRMAWLT